MSFKSACGGCRPSTTASPPQNGSTYRRSACCSQIGFRCETSQRLPPAHFKGGLNIVFLWSDASPEGRAVDLRQTERAQGVVKRMELSGEGERLPVRHGRNKDCAQRGDQCVSFVVHDAQVVEISLGRVCWTIGREELVADAFR